MVDFSWSGQEGFYREGKSGETLFYQIQNYEKNIFLRKR